MGWPNPSDTRWLGGPDRAIVENGLTLHVHRMAKRVCGEPGSSITGVWQWTVDGEPWAKLGYCVRVDTGDRATLTLDYKLNGEPVTQTIRLERRPCRFGGGRWYAHCPHTGRTAANLYLPSGGPRFLSRYAYRLGYRSQSDCAIGRAASRRHKLVARLNLSDAELPIKPKWMRWKTFDRAVDRLERDDLIWRVEMLRRFGTSGSA